MRNYYFAQALTDWPPLPGTQDLRRPRKQVQRREDLPKLVGAQVRHILLLVEEFRALCELKAGPHPMAEALEAAIAAARVGFELVAKMRVEDPHVNPHGAPEGDSRCICELERVLSALRVSGYPSEHELEHAVDPLIMMCVRFDAVVSETRSARCPSIRR
jgi:hypothetical protein